MSTRDRSKINKNKKEQREERLKRQRTASMIKWSGLALVLIAVIAGLVWFGTRPVLAVGEEVQVASADHVPEGSDPGPYPTNPPAGGKHYPGTYQAGFYEEADLANLQQRYEGYLVHNLEHGYIIFWYNCQNQSEQDCETLKSSIRQVMDENNNHKVIAFPWPSQSEPLVMTSWNRIMRFDQVNLDKMREFYRLNLNKSPEPDAP